VRRCRRPPLYTECSQVAQSLITSTSEYIPDLTGGDVTAGE